MATGAKALKGVQDRLGAINDCVTTIDLLPDDPIAVAAIQKRLDRANPPVPKLLAQPLSSAKASLVAAVALATARVSKRPRQSSLNCFIR